MRDKTKVLAEHHTTLANAIEKTAVVELERVRTDIKAHIASLNEATVLANEVEKEVRFSFCSLLILPRVRRDADALCASRERSVRAILRNSSKESIRSRIQRNVIIQSLLRLSSTWLTLSSD